MVKIKILLLTIPLLFAPNISMLQENDQNIKKTLLQEISRHPDSQPQDIYKFLYQAAFGSAHAVEDTAAVRNWMEREISGLNYSVKDQLVDTLSPDDGIVRVNLRPYLQKGYEPENLLHAFVKTANNYRRSLAKFKKFWKAAEEMAAAGKFKFTKEDLHEFFLEQEKNNFPAVHHSKEYSSKYKPAYRVIDTQYLTLQ